jgi:hypothetical protein
MLNFIPSHTATFDDLATFLVWYLDNTGAHEVHSYAYVDAASESEACTMIRSMGIDAANVVPQGDANVWNRSVARRYYAATGDVNA